MPWAVHQDVAQDHRRRWPPAHQVPRSPPPLASLLLSRGINPQGRPDAGDATIQITLDLYSHVLPDIQEQATQEIDRALPLGSGLSVLSTEAV